MAFAEFEMDIAPCVQPEPGSDGDTLYQTGLKFSLGEEVELDLVEAHKWFNLAAAKGHDAARDLRQEMADQMTQEQIRLAQKAAREFLRRMN